MNCKPGELAIVVKSECGNEGKIVRCIRLATRSEANALSYWADPLWITDVVVNRRLNGKRCDAKAVPDKNLRPIRPKPDDAVDEMVIKTGLPEIKEITA